MAIIQTKLVTNLPAQVEDSVPKELLGTIQQLYNSVNNLARLVGKYTGIDAPSEDELSFLSFSDTVIIGNSTRLYVPASVAITAGQVINLHDNAGVLNARLAAATSASTMAHAIANTSASAGQTVELQLWHSLINSIGGMSVGTLYWLSTVPGAVQNIAPTGVGQIQQAIGVALNSSTMAMNISSYYRQL